METLLAYITIKDKEEARKIGRHLVEKKLAACVNLLPGMESQYFWEGKLETAEECVLIAKTFEGIQTELVVAVKALHSYSVPCILFLPVTGGNKDYLEWLSTNVKRVV